MRTVQVLMSTYNGGNNIIKQVNSIQKQKNVKVLLTIRDDGSNNETLDVLRTLEKKYENTTIIYGENIGYKKSFLTLLSKRNKNNIDYYAFSDQDDIWDENKLNTAVNMLDKETNKVKLYTSSLSIYNENMEYVKKSDISSTPNNIYSFFTRNRYAGCTYVFSERLAELSSNYEKLRFKNSEMPEHDFLVGAFAYAFGIVIIDSESYIKHIRYPSSVTSGGNGIKKRIQVELFNTFKRKDTRQHMAEILINNDEKISSNKIFQYLELVRDYKSKIKSKVQLARYMDCGNTVGNVEAAIKVLIGNF